MMKAEFSDAYRMRNSVLIGLLASLVVTILAMVYGASALMRWVLYWVSLGMANVKPHLMSQGSKLAGPTLSRECS